MSPPSPPPPQPDPGPTSRGGVVRWRRRLAWVAAVGIVPALVSMAWWSGARLRAEALADRAEASYGRGRWATALEDARRALSWNATDHRAAAVAARSLTRLGRVEEAEPYYQAAGPLDPEDQHVRALALIEAHRANEAAGVYETMLARDPSDARALQRLSALRLSQSRWVEALDLAGRLARIPGAEVRGHALAGAIHHNFANHGIPGHFRAAVASFLKVLELDPDLSEVPLPRRVFWEYLGRDLIAEGRPAEARRYLEREMASGGEDAGLIELVGDAAQAQGELPVAERAWRRALELEPDRANALIGLGQLALARHRPEESILLLERAARLAPNSFKPIHGLSLAHRLLGHVEEADRLSRRAETLRKRMDAIPTPR